MNYRVRNIVLAVALAGLAAVLTSVYVSSYRSSVREGEESVTVFVAASNVPPGTTGAEAVARGLVSAEKVTRRTVVPGAISDPSRLDGLVATDTIYAGEQISANRFRPAEEGGVRAELKGTMRVIQVPGDPHQLLSGTLKSGDRVDILGVWTPTGQQKVSRIVLRDILVLRTFGSGNPGLSGTVKGGTSVQLAVTDTQSSKLYWLLKNGQWTFELRPPVNAEDSPENIETDESLLSDGLSPAQRRKLLGVNTEGSN